MSGNDEDWPEVDVVWWTKLQFHIRCPYCEELHHHGLNSYDAGSRRAHCNHPDPKPYRYTFPIDQKTGRVAYEFDKRKARFVNVCALSDLDESSSDDEDEQLADEFRSKATIFSGPSTKPVLDCDMYDAAQETVTITMDDGRAFEGKAIHYAISHYVTGQVDLVENYLDHFLEASNFLHGRDPWGDTILIMAAREQAPPW